MKNLPGTSDGAVPLPPTASSEAVARRFAAGRLSDWGIGHLAEDVLLVVSEMVANVLRHTDGQPSLRISRVRSGVRIEVEDNSPVLPAKRPGGADGGWGLRLIEGLSDRWGVVADADGKGKLVWSEVGTEDLHKPEANGRDSTLRVS